MNTPFIQCERIYFCHWNSKNSQDARALWSNPLVSKYISTNGIFTEKEIEYRLNTEINNQLFYGVQYWPFYEKISKKLIGCCGFRPYDDSALEFGVHIISDFWRQGYAVEAATAAIAYCTVHIKPEKIIAGHNPNNMASAALLKKLGFTFTHDEYYEPTGLMHPTYILELI